MEKKDLEAFDQSSLGDPDDVENLKQKIVYLEMNLDGFRHEVKESRKKIEELTQSRDHYKSMWSELCNRKPDNSLALIKNREILDLKETVRELKSHRMTLLIVLYILTLVFLYIVFPVPLSED